MIKRQFILYTTLVAALGLSAPGFAADPPIYGSQLMTAQERAEHRDRMRNAKSDAERQQIRNEHHERMRIRAKERGVTLPEVPPSRGQGKGMGPGDGMGGGMGGGRRN